MNAALTSQVRRSDLKKMTFAKSCFLHLVNFWLILTFDGILTFIPSPSILLHFTPLLVESVA